MAEKRDTSREQDREQRTGRRRDWADDAAQARTADDPRAMAPHDAQGTPSTGGGGGREAD